VIEPVSATTAPATTMHAWPAVPGYKLLGKLGEGGMGAVYKAHHHRLNRVVALKVVLDAEQARPAERVRFLREAEVTARLQHPNIVQIYEVGQHLGQPYSPWSSSMAKPWPDRWTALRSRRGRRPSLVEVLARAVHFATSRASSTVT